MTEPVSLASGLATLAIFALESTIKLYDTIKGFNSHLRRVRDFVETLEALNDVLGPLANIVSTNNDTNLTALEVPLLRCGEACEYFEKEIRRISSESREKHISYRDWARLRCMGNDMDGFQRLLLGYKLTIDIALIDVNLEKSNITYEKLDIYEDLVETTRAELEACREDIDRQLGASLTAERVEPNMHTSDLQVIQDDRLGIQKCIQICAQLSEHIDQIEPISKTRHNSPPITCDGWPESVTSAGLRECKKKLLSATTKLEERMQYLMECMVTESTNATTPEEYTNLTKMSDEWTTIRHCLNICSAADDRLQENICSIENYATGDGGQIIVSTNRKTIHGQNRGLGWRSTQIGGCRNDASVPRLLQNFAGVNGRRATNEGQNLTVNTLLPPNAAGEPSQFQERYGRGFPLTLNSDATPDGDSGWRDKPNLQGSDATAIEGMKYTIRGVRLFSELAYGRKVTGKGESIMVYDPKKNMGTRPFWENGDDPNKEETGKVPAGHRVRVIGATVKFTHE
ncbi:hypothetical protein BDV30DRAFT_234930 [Aspergillus minisclerotigenes]|uniref:Azaphilone pigments biosynthesis cluster protein L N-terminal domain-containing protein n=1 Tax=Aspergillus minisclerotigenes TaxID=656917 RepID=A0A5N6JFP4_9EURO|nr:hypothetical protein BDV30DRAFT_234930 [Aspergillus minisclerotigenes]